MSERMTCERCRELLDEYRRDELSPGERLAVEEHLAGCAECAAELRANEQLGGMLREMAASGPGACPSLHELALAARQQIEGDQRQPIHHTRFRVLYPYAIAASLALVVGVGSMLYLNTRGGRAPVIASSARVSEKADQLPPKSTNEIQAAKQALDDERKAESRAVAVPASSAPVPQLAAPDERRPVSGPAASGAAAAVAGATAESLSRTEMDSVAAPPPPSAHARMQEEAVKPQQPAGAIAADAGAPAAVRAEQPVTESRNAAAQLKPAPTVLYDNQAPAKRKLEVAGGAIAAARQSAQVAPAADRHADKVMLGNRLQSAESNDLPAATPAVAFPVADELKRTREIKLADRKDAFSASASAARTAAGGTIDADSAKQSAINSTDYESRRAEWLQAPSTEEIAQAGQNGTEAAAAGHAGLATTFALPAVARLSESAAKETSYFRQPSRASGTSLALAKKLAVRDVGAATATAESADAQLRLAEQLARDPATSRSAVIAYQRCLSPDFVTYFSAEALQDIRAQLDRLTSGTQTAN